MGRLDMILDHQVAMVVTFLLVVTLFGGCPVSAQDEDFSSPIKCYTCEGPVDNSPCSDPIDVREKNISFRECEHGICLKWTKYKNHVLHIKRTCSSDLNFRLTMIDGVCRTERNGNGYLCMCGKPLCNHARSIRHAHSTTTSLLLLFLPTALVMVVLSWITSWCPGDVTAGLSLMSSS